jgi:hypothetical protein
MADPAVDRSFMHQQVDTIVNGLQALVRFANDDPGNRDQINAIVDQLISNAAGLTNEIKAILKLPKLSDGKPTLEMSDLADALKAITLTGAETSNLDNFLANVGSSLVSAQKSLNQQSREYSESAAVEFKGLIPPAQFAIPKVTAEMTVGLNRVTERAVNLIFFTDKDQQTSFVQSKISFDLVAAPPPPGASINLTPFLVLQGRPDFLAELERLPEVAKVLTTPKSSIHFGVIFAVPKASTTGGNDDSVYVVVYVIQDAGKSILDPDWKTIILVAVRRVDGKLQLYDKLLEAADTNPLAFPKTKSDRVTSFGDALFQIVASIHEWMASVGFPPEVS